MNRRRRWPSQEALDVASCLCERVQYVFVSGKVNETPFGMHVKIAYPPAGRLLTWCVLPVNECK